MNTFEIAGAVLGGLCFLIWIPCVVSWIRRGVTIPRYIHLVAATSFFVGIVCVIALLVAGMATIGLSIALLTSPPTLTYFGWFWLFGPEISSK